MSSRNYRQQPSWARDPEPIHTFMISPGELYQPSNQNPRFESKKELCVTEVLRKVEACTEEQISA